MKAKVEKMDVNVDMNCRFCKNVLHFENSENEQDSFRCAIWDKKHNASKETWIWVWPEMDYYCDKFEGSGPNATRVFELEMENEALRKELEQFQ
jgi:hypothetical protein